MDWCGRAWLTRPLRYDHSEQWTEPCALEGWLRVVSVRTWAGCMVEPEEESRYPRIVTLELANPLGVHAALKLFPSDSKARDSIRRELRRYSGKPASPPFEREQEPLLTELELERLQHLKGACEGQSFCGKGLSYPMFRAGGVFSFAIWGFYLEP